MYLQGYLCILCSHRCNYIRWEANLPMQFVLLVGKHSLPSVKSFSGKYYLTNHIRNCSTYLYTSKYLQAFQKKWWIVMTVHSSRHFGTRSLPKPDSLGGYMIQLTLQLSRHASTNQHYHTLHICLMLSKQN